MTILYRRAVRLTVAGLVIEEGLRINFELERSIDATQDRGTVKIYNLSEEHSARIEERGRAVTLEAGYQDGAGLAVLFAGEAQRVRAGRDRLAHIVTIDIGDQVRQKNRLGGIYSDSLAGPVKVRRIAQRIIAAMELAPGPLDNIPADATFTNWHEGGSRPASASLTTLLASVDCTWFEEDGLIRINRVGMGQVDAPALTTSPQNRADRDTAPNRSGTRAPHVPGASRAGWRGAHDRGRGGRPQRAVENSVDPAQGGQLVRPVRDRSGHEGVRGSGDVLTSIRLPRSAAAFSRPRRNPTSFFIHCGYPARHQVVFSWLVIRRMSRWRSRCSAVPAVRRRSRLSRFWVAFERLAYRSHRRSSPTVRRPAVLAFLDACDVRMLHGLLPCIARAFSAGLAAIMSSRMSPRLPNSSMAWLAHRVTLSRGIMQSGIAHMCEAVESRGSVPSRRSPGRMSPRFMLLNVVREMWNRPQMTLFAVPVGDRLLDPQNELA